MPDEVCSDEHAAEYFPDEEGDEEVWDDERAIAWMREFEPDYEAKVRRAAINDARVRARFILRSRVRPPRLRLLRPASRRREPRVRRHSSGARSRSPGRPSEDDPDLEPASARRRRAA
jgi:hypothetical protein